MPLVQTQDLEPSKVHPQQLQVYCGLDCCVTLEVLQVLHRTFPSTAPDSNAPNLIYQFERALQAPALEMMLRGFRIDELERRRALDLLRGQQQRVLDVLTTLAVEVWGRPLNPRSHAQLTKFFYSAMKVPEQWTSQRGVKKLSMNREALEKLQAYFHTQPFVLCILKFRDLAKQIETLETEVDSDGRLRSSLNIAGTKTGRWSSAKNAFGTGGNIFNIKKDADYAEDQDPDTIHSLRRIFIADPGKKLCVIDYEQSEARDVGWLCGVLFGDWTYLDIIEKGDLHTHTARMIWPDDLPWTGNDVLDRPMAEQKFYRHFSRRDMSKRGGHGSSYLGTPFTMARHLKVPQVLMEHFQKKFFGGFPAIPMWHRWVAEQLQTKQHIVTPLGRKLTFFGRPQDEATLREAVAAGPQSTTADRTSLGLYRVWRDFHGRVELLNQGYDSITFQFDESDHAVLDEIRRAIVVPLRHGGREFVIPTDCKIGWNWGSARPDNPDGLAKWKGSDSRTRTDSMNRIL